MKRLSTVFAMAAVAALALLAGSPAAHATDFKNAVAGQPVADNLVGIGNFQVQLPQGAWVVVSKGSFRAGQQGNGNPTPPLLNLVVARTEAAKVLAVLFLAAPENTYQTTSRWSDDPCKSETAAVVKDTLEQTFAMPECFTVGHFGPAQIERARSTAVVDAQKWAKTANLAMPDSFVRVYYTKYHGGDFFRSTTYLAGASADIPNAETWGRAGVASLSPMVKGKASPGVLPALPAFVK